MYLGFCYLTTASETAYTSPLIKSKEFARKVAIIYLPLYQTSTESARVADQLITTGFNNPRRVLVLIHSTLSGDQKTCGVLHS